MTENIVSRDKPESGWVTFIVFMKRENMYDFRNSLLILIKYLTDQVLTHVMVEM